MFEQICCAFEDDVFCDGVYFNAVEVNIIDGILSVVNEISTTIVNTPVFIVRYFETGKLASGTGFMTSNIVAILQDKYKAHANVTIEKANILLLEIASLQHLNRPNSSDTLTAKEVRLKTKRRQNLMKECLKRDDNHTVGATGCLLLSRKDVKSLSAVKWPATGFGNTFKNELQGQMAGPSPSPNKLNTIQVPKVVSDILTRDLDAQMLLACLDSWKAFSPDDESVLTLQNQFQVVSSINPHITRHAFIRVARVHKDAIRRSKTASEKVSSIRSRPLTGDPRSAMFQLMEKCGTTNVTTVDGLEVANGNQWLNKTYRLSNAYREWNCPLQELVCQVVQSNTRMGSSDKERFVYPIKKASEVSAVKRELDGAKPSVQRSEARKRKSPDDPPSLQDQLNTAANALPTSTANTIVDLSGTGRQYLYHEKCNSKYKYLSLLHLSVHSMPQGCCDTTMPYQMNY